MRVMLVKIQASGYGREELNTTLGYLPVGRLLTCPSLYTVQLVGTSDKQAGCISGVRKGCGKNC